MFTPTSKTCWSIQLWRMLLKITNLALDSRYQRLHKGLIAQIVFRLAWAGGLRHPDDLSQWLKWAFPICHSQVLILTYMYNQIVPDIDRCSLTVLFPADLAHGSIGKEKCFRGCKAKNIIIIYCIYMYMQALV